MRVGMSSYRCPSCGAYPEYFSDGLHSRVGVQHKIGCKLFVLMANQFPRLLERIASERINSAA